MHLANLATISLQMDPAQANAQAVHLMAVMLPMMFMFWIVGSAIVIVPFWQIFKKAGMAPGLAFLMILPLINLVMLYVLAFSQWKTLPPAGSTYPPAYPPTPYPPAQYPPTQYPPQPPPSV